MDPETITVDASYDGPRIGDDGVVTIDFVRAMVERFKDRKMIHRKCVGPALCAAACRGRGGVRRRRAHRPCTPLR